MERSTLFNSGPRPPPPSPAQQHQQQQQAYHQRPQSSPSSSSASSTTTSSSQQQHQHRSSPFHHQHQPQQIQHQTSRLRTLSSPTPHQPSQQQQQNVLTNNNNANHANININTNNNNNNIYDQLLQLYYRDTVDHLKQILSLETFTTKSALANTVFEEVDLFNPFEKLFSLSSSSSSSNDHHNNNKNNNSSSTKHKKRNSSHDSDDNDDDVDDFLNLENFDHFHHYHHYEHHHHSEHDDGDSDDDDDDDDDRAERERLEREKVYLSLEKCVKQLFVQHSTMFDDQLSPLLSFHILMYKRMKILDSVQEFQSLKTNDIKRLKGIFEHLPLSVPSMPREETSKLIKELQKAMQRSDVKKGFFAKLRRSRSESVYKLLSSHVSPYSMVGSDVSDLQAYLIHFTANRDNQMKKRSKAIVSLFLLALNRGSLLDVLMVLSSLLMLTSPPASSSSSEQTSTQSQSQQQQQQQQTQQQNDAASEVNIDPLPNDESDESSGIVVRPETLKALLQYQTTVKNNMPLRNHRGSHNWNSVHSDQQYSTQNLLSSTSGAPASAYTMPSHVVSGKKTLSIRRVFVFILSHLDMLCEAYLTGPNLLYRETKCVSASFCIEPVPQVFSLLKSMICRLMKYQVNTQRDKSHPQLYCISALFRIMRLNMEALSLWKQDNESFRSNSGRLSVQKRPNRSRESTSGSSPSTPHSPTSAQHNSRHSSNNRQSGSNGSHHHSHHSHSNSSDSDSGHASQIPIVNDFINDIKQFCLTLIHQPKSSVSQTTSNGNHMNNTTVTTNTATLNPVQKRQSKSMSSSLQKYSTNEDNIDIDVHTADEEDFMYVSRSTSGGVVVTVENTNNNNSNNNVQHEARDSSGIVMSPDLMKNPAIFDHVSMVLCVGFTLFYPTHNEQSQFFMDSLRNVHDPRKKHLLLKILVRMTHDLSLFDQFAIQGIGTRDDSVQFFDEIIDLLKSETMSRIRNVSTLDEASIDTQDVYFYLTVLASMWQNSLLKTMSSGQTRYRSSTVPTVSMALGTGKVLMDYAAKVLNASMELISMAHVQADDAESTNSNSTMSNGQKLLEIVKRSIFGQLTFPLYHTFTRFIWRCGSTEDEMNQLRRITSFLYPFTVDMLRAMNEFGRAIKQSDPTFDWSIVETDHPYQSKLSCPLQVTFDQPNVVSVAIKFDARSKTASSASNLKISANPQTTAQSLQFSGHGNTIPINPLMTWGNSMSLNFTSDKSSDWGMRCAVMPVIAHSWFYEMQKCIAWLGGRCSTFVLSRYPCSADELKCSSWLSSRLFINGLEDGRSRDQSQASRDTFLLDLIHNRNKAAELVTAMTERLKREIFALKDNEDVNMSERAVIASVLKHTDTAGLAMKVANLFSETNGSSDTQTGFFPPEQLLAIWRSARKLRTWMVQKRQAQQISYDNLRKSIVSKAEFLVGMKSATFPLVSTNLSQPAVLVRSNQRDVLHNGGDGTGKERGSNTSQMNKSLSKSKLEHMQLTSQPSHLENAIDKIKSVVLAWRVFDQWKSKACADSSKEDIQLITEITTLVLSFVQSDVDTTKLQSVIEKRKERALSRAKAFNMYTELLTCSSLTSVKAEIVQGVKTVLKTRSMKKFDRVDFHYFNNTEGCGPAHFNILSESFTKFLQTMLSELEPTKLDMLLSGMLREILETCFISFKPTDIGWVLELNLLEKLRPLMYSSDMIPDMDVKFMRKSASMEDAKEMSRRAWKLFRMLAVRSISMLEQWDDKNKNDIPIFLHSNMMSKLILLRDTIFAHMFDGFEKIIRNGSSNHHSVQLEEMLSLLVSLCNTKSAKACLSTPRFQALMLPLLKIEHIKVQELTLRLCSHLILGQRDSTNPSTDHQLSLVSLLFDFLGQYELHAVLGASISALESHTYFISLNTAKHVFILLRRLLEGYAPECWTRTVRGVMNRALTSSFEELNNICNLVSKNSRRDISRDQSESMKHIACALTLLVGFSYMPEIGENVLVDMNGKWMDARITLVEEDKHRVQVELLNDKTIHRTHFVPSENVRVKTQDPLSLPHVNITESTVHSFMDFVDRCGQLMYDDSGPRNDTSDRYLLLLSNLWMRALGVLDVLANNEHYLTVLLSNSKLINILNFAEIPTQIRYGKELKLDRCSFCFTGKQFTKQHYYPCTTCGMSNSRAVCTFCCRTCHRGHLLGNPEVGEFYCDCGAGEGKFACQSLKKAPEDPILTLARFQSMTLRLQRLMPIFHHLRAQNHPTAPLFAATRSMTGQENKGGPTCFKPLNARVGYTVESDGSITYDIFSATPFSMLGSDFYIPLAWPGFYFEIEILNFGHPSGTIAVGLSEEVNVNKHWPEVLESSFTYHVNTGQLFLGTKPYKSAYSTAGTKGDIIGCGWSKEANMIFFTKNGANLGNAFHVPTDGKTYFPVVIMKGNRASIKANFGSRPFQFNLAKSHKSLLSRPKTVPVSNSSNSNNNNNDASKSGNMETRQQLLREFLLLGYSAKLSEKALELYPNDPNGAASFLHRSKNPGSIREQLADQLVQMGFERDMSIFALKICKDDVNMALNWLLSDNRPLMEEVMEHNEEQVEKGLAFLGADCTQEELEELITKGILLNIDAKVNENMFSDVQIHNVCIDDLLVVSPKVTEDISGDSDTRTGQKAAGRARSTIGIVTKKLLNGAYVQMWDPQTGLPQLSFVKTQHLLTVPEDLRSTSMLDLASSSFSYYNTIASLTCRKLLNTIFMNLRRPLELDATFLNTQNLYKILKILFVDQYHIQKHNFTANHVLLSDAHRQLLEKLKLCRVSLSDSSTVSLFDAVLKEASADISNTISGSPSHRRVIFKSTMNNMRVPIRFWGASSICVMFDSRCELTGQDQLTLYFDANGRKQYVQFKASSALPKRFVVSADRFWFEFQTTNLREGLGFQFDVTPASFHLSDQLALSQPNLALATTVLRNVSETGWFTSDLKQLFRFGMKYLLNPFVPFKGSLTDAIINITRVIYRSMAPSDRPSLTLLKHFRMELEDLYKVYHRHHESHAAPLPIFHSMIDFISAMRMFIAYDVCVNLFPERETHEKHHFYCITDNTHKAIKSCAACTNCTRSSHSPKYLSQDSGRCEQISAKILVWKDSMSHSSLVPVSRLNLNPSDWFEHVAWVDQLAIVRELCECFAFGRELPNWVLFEAALEKRKKVSHYESAHPYTVVDGSGEISIPGAKTIFISFDKHSRTNRTERLLFSSRFKGGDDLGSYGGDELKDKTLIVHSAKLFYSFKSLGGDHETQCNKCQTNITGIRYRCTECDNVDLCEKCMRKAGSHNETHLFLKIRRPVDCAPAPLPHLYPNEWVCTSQFKGNVHVGVKCNNCGMSPIRGVRYWCENCEDYNLCDKCAEEEYKYHDRMHVFLRCVRPLPPKHLLPPNALPYGLVYEKEIDTHWGYMFSVSSSDSVTKYSDEKIQRSMDDIRSMMVEWNQERDAQLVSYVENFCNGWQSLEWRELHPTPDQLSTLPHLQSVTLKSIRYRFIVLKLLNRKLSRILYLLNLDSVDKKRNPEGLSTMIATIRERIFRSLKMDAWQHTITKSTIDTTIQPIQLKLNRHKAAELNDSPITYANNSLFIQAFNELQAMNSRVFSRKGGAWRVMFLGESADDHGGPFRESLTHICTELQTPQLDLFIPVPNQVHNMGENREKFIPNPQATSSKYLEWYRFMGKILGIGLLAKNMSPLDLPSLFWKLLVKEDVTTKDLEQIDYMCYQSICSLRNMEEQGITEETFGDAIGAMFSTVGSDGTEVELIKGGKRRPVTWERRFEYATMVEQYRLNELRTQIMAIKEGFVSIVTPRFFPIFTWNELEMLVCGSPTVDLGVLKKHTIYENYTVNSREIKDFWNVLESFDSKERSSYLRFVWGRARLPTTDEGFTHHMKIQKLDRSNPDGVLPLSHTCFFSIELPPYSSQAVMKSRLLYAITHCKAIDTDHTAMANEARNANVLQ